LLLPEENVAAPRAAVAPWKQRLAFGTLQLLWRHRVFVVCIVALTAGAGFAAARFRTPYYIAQATIFPPPVEGSIGGLGLAGVAGIVGSLGLGTPATSLFPLYETFTYSRSVITGLLNLPLDEAGGTGTLLDRLAAPDPDANRRLDAAVENVRQRLTFNTDKKTGVVAITYLDHDPRIAAYVVNKVVEALDRFDVDVATKRAGGKRKFIEQRMGESSRSLANAEHVLEQFRQENLRIGNAPDLLFEQVRLQREVEIEQQIYLALRKEYELARIDEERSLAVVNVLDRAVPPVAPAGPSVVKFTLAAGLLGAAIVVGFLALIALQPRRTLDELLLTTRLR
jgi:uncharacterized protein involved in exopolysaccharide biosynthesis